VRVDMTGPDNLSDVTNDLGCVVFGYIQAGPWTVNVSSVGLVGSDGTSPYSSGIGIVAGATVLKQIQLDEPSAIIANFQTQGITDAVPVIAKSPLVSVNNAKLPSPGWKTFPASPAAPTITATGLFPFKDGYGVYAGGCDSANPTQWDNDYFSTTPTGQAAFVVPTPGQPSTVTVRMPALNLEVRNAAGSAIVPNPHIVLKNADTDCTAFNGPQLSNAVGALANPGLPFGEYIVCADDGAGHKFQTPTKIADTDPAGTPKQTLSLTGTGTCPNSL
jgi:hypothetical protein